VSQTAARGRNRPTVFTGESCSPRYTAGGHITGFILRPFATRTKPIVEGGMYPQRPKERLKPTQLILEMDVCERFAAVVADDESWVHIGGQVRKRPGAASGPWRLPAGQGCCLRCLRQPHCGYARDGSGGRFFGHSALLLPVALRLGGALPLMASVRRVPCAACLRRYWRIVLAASFNCCRRKPLGT
jgi:hypothetical protein